MRERQPENVRQLLEARVAQHSDKPFLILESGERQFTYLEFDEQVNKAANMLSELGVSKGDRVSLLLTNRAEYLIFYFACFKIGAWAGPVNSLLKPKEIEYIVANSEAKVIITESSLSSGIEQSRKNIGSLCHVLVIDESGQWSAEQVQGSGSGVQGSESDSELRTRNSEPRRNDEAVIIYTSGTNGKPKGVLLTHGNLLSNAQQIAEWLRLTEEDRSLMIMPLFHVNALMTTCLAVLWVG